VAVLHALFLDSGVCFDVFPTCGEFSRVGVLGCCGSVGGGALGVLVFLGCRCLDSFAKSAVSGCCGWWLFKSYDFLEVLVLGSLSRGRGGGAVGVSLVVFLGRECCGVVVGLRW